jgi:REP element-mobilizing transposase RayT
LKKTGRYFGTRGKAYIPMFLSDSFREIYFTEKMAYNPVIHHRRSIRLKGYDYAKAGLYFITICVKKRKCLFGKIEKGQMCLNDAGRMVEKEWSALPQRFPNVQFVMPNHFHALMAITNNNGTTVGATLVVAHSLMVALKNNKGNGTTRNNNDPCDSVTSFNKTYPVGEEKPGEENIKNKSISKKRLHDKGQPQGIAPTVVPLQVVNALKILGQIVDAFKSITTLNYIHGVKTKKWPPFDCKLWQRNFCEHIIRDEQSHMSIAEYIANNPVYWQKDKLYGGHE